MLNVARFHRKPCKNVSYYASHVVVKITTKSSAKEFQKLLEKIYAIIENVTKNSILPRLKRKLENSDDRGIESSKRSTRIGNSDTVNSRGIFPNHRMICSKQRIKVSGKFHFPARMVTKTAEETLTKAATLRNDERMLRLISGVDLIAKEFRKHEKCFLEYTIFSKLPLVILSRLGHSITYDRICETETAQAELVQQLQSMSLNLPLLPSDTTQKVATSFWWDNFDRNIETSSGASSLHNTPGILFQEETDNVRIREDAVNISRSKRRSLKLKEAQKTPVSAI
eukprot:gene7883-13766_t